MKPQIVLRLFLLERRKCLFKKKKKRNPKYVSHKKIQCEWMKQNEQNKSKEKTEHKNKSHEVMHNERVNELCALQNSS